MIDNCTLSWCHLISPWIHGSLHCQDLPAHCRCKEEDLHHKARDPPPLHNPCNTLTRDLVSLCSLGLLPHLFLGGVTNSSRVDAMSISVCPPERLTESRITESANAQISAAAAMEISCGVGGGGKLRLTGGHMRGLCCSMSIAVAAAIAGRGWIGIRRGMFLFVIEACDGRWEVMAMCCFFW